MKPVLALVGRPNVGKSTLFNRLTRTRDAIVADYSGLTRDRHYGQARFDGRDYIVIDTGGFEPSSSSGVVRAMAEQTRQAVAEADVAIFLVDARAGLSAQDHEIAAYLRRFGVACVLAANKAEGMQGGAQWAEFYELGLGEVLPISAAHQQGLHPLMEAVFQRLPGRASAEEAPQGADEEGERIIHLAVAGRPNVGKSTLINTWLGEPRLVAFDQPGTTRDAIRVEFERAGQRFALIDTAGLRRKGRVFETVEKFSVVKTLQAIESADVAVIVLDATQGITDQDARIAGFALDAGRAIVFAVNKWDAVDPYQKEWARRQVAERLAFASYAEVCTISAQEHTGLAPLWRAIMTAYESAMCKLSTPRLTRLLQEAVQFQAPRRNGMFRPKLRYAHQGGSNPPIIVIHGNSLEGVTAAYKRFLEGRFRAAFGLKGTPLRIALKTASNPYSKKD